MVGVQVASTAFADDEHGVLPFAQLEPGTTVALHVHTGDELVAIDDGGPWNFVDESGREIEDDSRFPSMPPRIGEERHDALVFARVGGVASDRSACVVLDGMLVVTTGGSTTPVGAHVDVRVGSRFELAGIALEITGLERSYEPGMVELEIETEGPFERIRELTLSSNGRAFDSDPTSRSVSDLEGGARRTRIRYEVPARARALDVAAEAYVDPTTVELPLHLRVSVGPLAASN